MKRTLERAVLVVLDSVGIGHAPDAAAYGDEGSNTLGNTAAAVGGLSLPHLGALGIGNLVETLGVPPATNPQAAYGRMMERSKGKDTTTGHWEIAGLWLETPFPTYPDGFPEDIVDALERVIGTRILGNKVASGTTILDELGPLHLRTGYPILYTSADSVLQIAAHEDVYAEEELYELCRTARALMRGAHGVGRVIARPFTGRPGAFVRTAGRKDFSLAPSVPTLLDLAVADGVRVRAVGKINDIFAGRGISDSVPTASNEETVDVTLRLQRETEGPALIFANCVDFDSLWGHRRDPRGYAQGLEAFDTRVPELVAALGPLDLLLIVADHGCDPTMPGTDHTRELVPLLAVGPGVRRGVDLGRRESFSDVAATLADGFGIRSPAYGRSFWTQIWDAK